MTADLEDLVVRLVATRWWRHKRRLLQQYPQLISDAAQRCLVQLAAQRRADGRTSFVCLLHLALVRLAKEEGAAKAVALTRTSLERLPKLVGIGTGEMSRYLGTGDPGLLDHAIIVLTEAEQVAFEGHPERATVLSNLGLAHWHRHDGTGNPDDLSTALSLLEEAEQVAIDVDQAWIAAINHITALITDGLESINRAETILHNVTPPASADPADLPRTRASILMARFEHTRRPADIDGAIAGFEAALRHLDGDEKACQLNNLGVARSERYLLSGHGGDLDAAVDLLSLAVQMTPSESPQLAARRANLGGTLADRFRQRGQPSDLDSAITEMTAAVQLSPAGSPENDDWRMNLALGLRDRYTRDGELADLNQAVSLLDDPAQTTPAWLDQLATTLRTRWWRTGDHPDLSRALDLHRRAVAADTSPVLQHNAGGTYRAWWAATGDPTSLDRAIEAYLQTVDLMPEEDPTRPAVLANLAIGLCNRYDEGDQLAIDESIHYARMAVDSTALGSADRPGRLVILANALRRRHLRDGHTNDEQAAVAAYRTAIDLAGPIAADDGLRAGIAYGGWAASQQHWADAAQAYTAAVAAADRLLRRQLTPADTQAWIRSVGDLSTAAAFVHHRLDTLTIAVTRLEWGRARLLTKTLERDRADLATLEKEHPNLVLRYRAAAARVRALERRNP